MPKEFSIEPYLQNKDILLQTAEQIKKDFAFFDITIVLDNHTHTAFDDLYRIILPIIKNILSHNSQKIYSILYRIDISETQLKKEAQKIKENTAEEIITQLIIKRCLQKVVLRKLYSK